MNYETVILYIFGVVSTLYILHFGFYLVGANAYDVWQSRRHHRRHRAASQGRTHIYEPLVTIAISAHNEEKVIARCLDSLCTSSYQHVQIIVVDDGSKDETFAIVKEYAFEHPELNLLPLRKRKNGGKGAALNYALREYAQGELAMTLDADSIISRGAVGNAVAYFTDPNIVGVAANVQILDDFTVLGVLQKFEHMVGYRSKKVYSLANCEFVVGGVASTYRMEVLREVGFYDTDTVTEDIGLSMKIVSRGNRAQRLVYAADVVAATEGVDTFHGLLRQRYRWKYGSLQNLVKYRHLIGTHDENFTRSLALYRLPMAVASEFALLFAPAIWGYVLYWTFASLSLKLIVGAYLTITVYTFITIWFDENISVWDRVRLSAYAPIAYFIYYIMDLIQFVSIVKCLRRSHFLLRQKSIGSLWVSPRRIGREVAVG